MSWLVMMTTIPGVTALRLAPSRTEFVTLASVKNVCVATSLTQSLAQNSHPGPGVCGSCM